MSITASANCSHLPVFAEGFDIGFHFLLMCKLATQLLESSTSFYFGCSRYYFFTGYVIVMEKAIDLVQV